MALESGNTASSSSSSSADTYIGSRISVISKSEIRYEGLLYCLNPQDSTLGLNNVRSYGTEGRVKDGPQIPPSDKVYEYILFRGSDIKDLQVKSSPSPPAQPEEQIHNDPAIIQSSFSGGPPSTSKTAPFINGSLTDSNPYNDNTKSYTSLIPEPWNQNTNISSYTIPSQWQGYNDVTGHNNNNNNTTTQNPTQFTNAPLPSNTSNHGSLFWKSPSQSYPELLGGTNVTSSASYPVSSFVDPTSGQLHYPPRLLTPDQLSQPRASELPGPQKLYPDQKDMGVNVISSAYSNSSPPVQPPLLPLPPPTQKLQFSRGFSEEFDFEAMNEKFKKDEIWGSLGKAKQENHSEGITYGREMSNNGFFTEAETKPAYKKDDFFDSMSRNSNSRGGKNGQSSFSNRMKLDTETFGNYHHQAGRGGFGVGRGRRGYHYRGRGRGGPMRP